MLVEPFSIRMPTSSGYHVTSPIERADLGMVAAFRDWVLQLFEPARSAA